MYVLLEIVDLKNIRFLLSFKISKKCQADQDQLNQE